MIYLLYSKDEFAYCGFLVDEYYILSVKDDFYGKIW